MDKPDRAAILAEPAGPRLDAWTARWVMEWPEVDSESEKLKSEADGVAWSERWWPAGGAERHGPEGWEEWSPSTPSAATWEVMSKIAKENCGVTLHFDIGPGEWLCSVEWDTTTQGMAVYDPCPAVAVCRACLLAVEWRERRRRGQMRRRAGRQHKGEG